MPDNVELMVTCDYPKEHVSRIIYKAWKAFRKDYKPIYEDLV